MLDREYDSAVAVVVNLLGSEDMLGLEEDVIYGQALSCRSEQNVNSRCGPP
jgi:hypothetical protein